MKFNNMLANLLLNLILWLFWAQSGQTALVNSAPLISLKPEARVIEIAAPRAAVLAAQDRFFLYTKNADIPQPIASITKLMTALVFLETNPDWEKIYKIQASDQVEGGRLNLFVGDEAKLKDIFYTSLLASDNGATMALVHASGLSETEFVARMNDKANDLNLNQTRFVDPIGLSNGNVSSAREVARLAQAALNREEIRLATEKKEYIFTTSGGRVKKIESTDYLLFDSEPNGFKVLGGKTGYTDQAGYCFVGHFQDPAGRELISVILNSAGKNERFRETKALVNWVLASYFWTK